MSQRTGLSFRIYRNALILLQSMQNHRKHLMFSKVITKLYAPVLWRQLRVNYTFFFFVDIRTLKL